MAQTPTAVRLFRRIRAGASAHTSDFGDHGTAFGLDLSLRPIEPSMAPASASGVLAHDSSFWRRLAERRRRTPG